MKYQTAPYAVLLEILSKHVGAANGITARQIARELKLTKSDERWLPRRLEHLHLLGIAVGRNRGRGYYIAATAAELKEICDSFRARAMAHIFLEARLRDVPIADLLRQIADTEDRTDAAARPYERLRQSPAVRRSPTGLLYF